MRSQTRAIAARDGGKFQSLMLLTLTLAFLALFQRQARAEEGTLINNDANNVKPPRTGLASANETVSEPQSGDSGLVSAHDKLDSPADSTRSGVTKSAAVERSMENEKFESSSLRVSNDALSGMRGGFFTAGGAQFDFGASIKTMVNGQLALQTNLTWTPQGANIASLSGLGQQIASQVQSTLANAGITGNANNLAVNTPSNLTNLDNAASNAGSNPAGAAANIATPATNLATNALSGALNSAANVGTSGPPQSVTPAVSSAANIPQTTITIPTTVTGVNIPSAGGGSTQILNNISANQIQSIILNSASGQTINQNTNVTLTIYNLQQWQQQLAQHALSAQLANEVMAASGFAH